MPELPEVETTRTLLAEFLPGRRVEDVTVKRRDLRVPLPANLEKQLKGRTATHIVRRAKYLYIHLDDGQVLVVHLGMSGSMVVHRKRPPLRKHDHVAIRWSGGVWSVFHDPRRFGLMLLLSESELATHDRLAGLGPEPLAVKTDAAYLHGVLHASQSPIKSVIMDQRRLVGVGNIYACEALFLARVDPRRVGSRVTKPQAARLMEAIKKVLKAAIASGGSTLRDYVGPSGADGHFQHHFQVYDKKGKPCPVCATPIAVIRQSGRSTFFCPHCQK